MPRKKAAPKEEQPKAVTSAPEAEALKAAHAPPAVPEAPPEASDPLPAPETLPVPSDLPQEPETLPAPSDLPQEPETLPAPSDLPQEPETPPAPSDPPQTGSDLVNPRDGQTPAEQGTPPGPDGVPAIVTASKGLNLRAGPGFGFDVLSVLESGTLLLILNLPMGVKVPGWALVWCGETAGWVSDKHLRRLVD